METDRSGALMGRKLNSSSEPSRFDVFLSFNGSNTRRGLTGRLYSALVQSEVSVLMDDEELQVGGEINALKKVIEDSRVAIPVFSRDYASSMWCLTELASILECHKSKGMEVLPVFHGITPSDVRDQRGRYEEALAVHGRKYPPDEVDRWRTALTEAAQLPGFTSEDGNEALLVQEIVRVVSSKLDHSMDDMSFHVPANLVGMDSHLETVYKLLDIDTDEVRMVALCGMGGLGKTTIAKTIFNEIGRNFRYKGFSSNVRETCQDSLTRGLIKLQRGLLLQMGTKVEIWDVDEGSNKIKQRCCSSSTLLVIDDINHREQLEKLAGACHWFGRGSKIIITTRNKSLLNDRKEIRLYEVPLLGHTDAYQLFMRTLFLENEEIDAYKELIPKILGNMQGLPLAIKVVAAHLRREKEEKWAKALKELKEIPDPQIFDILRLSYDGLGYRQQETLLDIACFFKGQPETYVRSVLECCDLRPDTVLGDLWSRYLISIKHDKVDMHDMIQEMGREIVRLESTHNPGKRSRLWSPEDIRKVLTGDMGTDTIKGIKLEFAVPEKFEFNANAFNPMKCLRVFIADNVTPSGNSINFPRELRWLEWPEYPSLSLPLHDNDNEEIVGLCLRKSQIILSEDDLKVHILAFIISCPGNIS